VGVFCVLCCSVFCKVWGRVFLGFLGGAGLHRRHDVAILTVRTFLKGARNLQCVQCSQCSGAKIAVGIGKSRG